MDAATARSWYTVSMPWARALCGPEKLMGVASIYQTLITGVLVILAVTVDQISRKKAR